VSLKLLKKEKSQVSHKYKKIIFHLSSESSSNYTLPFATRKMFINTAITRDINWTKVY